MIFKVLLYLDSLTIWTEQVTKFKACKKSSVRAPHGWMHFNSHENPQKERREERALSQADSSCYQVCDLSMLHNLLVLQRSHLLTGNNNNGSYFWGLLHEMSQYLWSIKNGAWNLLDAAPVQMCRATDAYVYNRVGIDFCALKDLDFKS